ncbi:hypothetical protein BC938DRAFT_483866 [Jimgerdemannia flammicorona]|uniref:Uncharacterized protein n=1 Tax=Jimgerdemannia flammicorona TaxID=994334 RepID=A0A433QB39_9FUNG|nr:hypothetical protein BC938DRAFT_483866 [Jimgerdemannia flammicorona]
MKETVPEGNDQTDDDERFKFFVRYVLLDFVASFKYRAPQILLRDIFEGRLLSNVFLQSSVHFETHFRIFVTRQHVQTGKADHLILQLSDGREIVNVEVSGPPFKPRGAHTVGDIKKLLMVAVCNLCRLFGNFLDCDVEIEDVIGDRLTLFTVSIAGRKEYLVIELASCIIPFAFDDMRCYTKIFNLFAVLRNELVQQEKLRKKLHSSVPSNVSVRDWLHIFDADLEVESDAVDEIAF